MRILMVVLNITGQGTYRRAYPLGRALAQFGHEVTLCSTAAHRSSGIKEWVEEGVHLVESPDLMKGPFRSGWDPWNVFQRTRWQVGKHFDIVHAFECRPTVIYPSLFAHRQGAKLVIDWADWFGKGGSVEERPNPLVRAVLRPVETYYEEHFRPSASGNTVICTTLYEKALELTHQPEGILRFPNGCDTAALRPLEQQECRQSMGLPAGVPIIGYIGSAFIQGADLMVKSFTRVLRDLPHSHFIWIGARPLESRRKLENLPNVHLFEHIPENQLNEALAACDLFWLPLCNTPANQGRWPLKLNDYLSVGRPIVATPVGDVTELFQRHAVGLLSPDDPEHFANSTVGLLKTPIQSEIMGIEARRVAENEFSWDSLARQVEAFYRQILRDS